MRAAFVLVLITVSFFWATAQKDEIMLNNGSFEEIPHKGSPEAPGIRGWYDCGNLQFPSETPPDIHPINAWNVTTIPSDGRTYLGMVVRDNDSWESISQRLKQPLEEGKCYKFSIDLSRSEYYVSASRITQRVENYTEPAVLRVWGGTGVCGRQELLGESAVISSNNWQEYVFEFEPSKNVNYFSLEAFYEVPVLIPYNGHLLLDNASLIQQIPCEGEDLYAVEEIENLVESTVETPVTVRSGDSKNIKDEVVELAIDEVKTTKNKKLLEDLDADKVKKGQTIRIENLYFSANAWDIRDESNQVLDEIFDFLKDNRHILVEIGGHTSTPPEHEFCDRLSTNRAKEVAKHLVRKGISPKRLKYKGYGKRQPLIANDKYDMTARKKNQRVEIKILSLDYSEATGFITNPSDSKSSQKEG